MEEGMLIEMIVSVFLTFSSNITSTTLWARIFTRWTIVNLVLILWMSSFFMIVYHAESTLDSCVHGGCGNDNTSPSHSIEVVVEQSDSTKSVRAKGEMALYFSYSTEQLEIQELRKPRADRPQQQLLRKMEQTSNPIYFLHIGKAGGTSIDSLMKQYRRTSHTDKQYFGFEHFDWSYIQMHLVENFSSGDLVARDGNYGIDVSQSADVITFLRHPVSRSISQFYFSKRLKWAKKSDQAFIHQTIEEYIHDPKKTWFQPLNDGESGVDFLAGIFNTDGWVMTDNIQTEAKEYLRQNRTAACLLAAKRLEQTAWFGLLEDVDRSMKLLQLSLGLSKTPVLRHRNTAKEKYPIPSDEIKLEIGSHLPKDMWLYKFATRLFQARWNHLFHGSEYVAPELPLLPDFEAIDTG